jgi:hypothetical protein
LQIDVRPNQQGRTTVNISNNELQRRAEQRRQSLEFNRQKLAYTIPELVSDSGVGRSKIYEEIAAGRLKVKKLGKRTLVLHGDAIAWLASLPAA